MSEAARAQGLFRLLAALSLLLTAAFYLWLGLHNALVGFAPDDAVYLLMADAHSPWHGADDALGGYLRQHAQFPLLFPLFLALIGAGSDALMPAKIGVALSFALAAGLFGGWLRGMGVPRWSALALALFGAWSPAYWIMATDVWSEGLFLCLVWLALCVILRPAQGLWLALLAGLLAGAAFGTRSIGIVLLPAVLVGLWPRGRAAVLAALGGCLLMLVLIRQLSGGGAESYGGELLKFYGTAPWPALLGQLGKVAAGLPAAVGYDLFLWRSQEGWRAGVLALTVGIIALGAWRARRQRPLLVYGAGYLLVVALWPFPGELNRLLLPLLPVALFLLWRGVASHPRREWPGLLLVAALLVVSWPQLSACLRRVWTPVPVAALDHWRTTRYWLDATRGGGALPQIAALEGYRRAVMEIGALVPAGACVYTPQVHLVLWYARRPAFLTPATQGGGLACRWIHAVLEETPVGPPLYPLTQWPGLRVVAAWSREGQRLPLPSLNAASYLMRLP